MVAVTGMGAMADLTEAETEARTAATAMAATAMAVTGGLMVAMVAMVVMVATVATGVMAAATGVEVTAVAVTAAPTNLIPLRCLLVCGRRPRRTNRHRCPRSRPRMGPGTRRTHGRRIISGNRGLIRSTRALAR